jgi:hypothetical protein
VDRLARFRGARQHLAGSGNTLSIAGFALPAPGPYRRQGESHRRLPREDGRADRRVRHEDRGCLRQCCL